MLGTSVSSTCPLGCPLLVPYSALGSQQYCTENLAVLHNSLLSRVLVSVHLFSEDAENPLLFFFLVLPALRFFFFFFFFFKSIALAWFRPDPLPFPQVFCARSDVSVYSRFN